MKTLSFYRKKAKNIRKNILLASHQAKSAHIGSSLSPVDILTVLYFGILKIDPRNYQSINHDRFILSKGHGGLGLYATLCERGFFSKDFLDNYGKNNSVLAAHPILGVAPGIEATTGSLGHGLSMAVGMALAAKRDKKSYRVFALLSDGECDEGSVWEAVMAAGHWALDNLVAIIDYNKIQSFGRVKEVLDLEPLADKWRAFGWGVKEVDGHNFSALEKTFTALPFIKNKPSVVIAHTIKGKGVSFMEDKLEWHYKNLTDELLEKALREL